MDNSGYMWLLLAVGPKLPSCAWRAEGKRRPIQGLVCITVGFTAVTHGRLPTMVEVAESELVHAFSGI